MPKEEAVAERISKALGVWAKRHRVRPVDFEDAMGWSYNHAWRVLSGVDPFSDEAYGTFIAAYGIADLQEIFKIAGLGPNGTEEAE